MNARNVYMTILVAAGLALSTGFAKAGTTDSGLESALERIQQEQLADFHRRSLDNFPQTDLRFTTGSFLNTGLADAAIANSQSRIRLQGQLARWAIQEEQLAGYRTGMLAQSLVDRNVGVIAATAADRDGSPFDRAKGLLKSARFQWPEFMPPGLLR